MISAFEAFGELTLPGYEAAGIVLLFLSTALTK